MASDIDHAVITGLKIADPRAVFRGLTYGQWAGVWMNHLFSEFPDINYHGGNGMTFLRGNVQYASTDDPEHAVFSSLTLESRLKIQEDTAVFVPIINSKFVIDDDYQGHILKDEISLRNTARGDTVNGGDLGVRIKPDTTEKDSPLVKDLNEFYIESPLFSLSIPETSAYKTRMQSPMESGNYYCITAGIFVIISQWPVGKYRLSVLGVGLGNYLTRSVYDIEVEAAKTPLLNDISKTPYAKPGKTSPRDPMDFVAKWSDTKPTKPI